MWQLITHTLDGCACASDGVKHEPTDRAILGEGTEVSMRKRSEKIRQIRK